MQRNSFINTSRHRCTAVLFALTACMTILRSVASANGYNRINEIAIPALVVLFALSYTVLALLPAAAVHLAVRKALRDSRPRFIRAYMGALAGGEAGIALSWAFAKWFAGPGWNSYHYTLYPWLILGFALAAAAALSLKGAVIPGKR